MTIAECFFSVQERLNKLSSNSKQNIELYSFVYAFNKAQAHWVEDRIKVEEANKVRTQEIQQLLKPVILNCVNGFVDFPADFLHIERVTPNASKNQCDRLLYSTHLVEEGNIPELITNDSTKPSFEWEETFYTLQNNKIKIYSTDFTVKTAEVIYYRRPVQVDIVGYEKLDKTLSTNIDPEFNDASLQEILDITVAILSADTADQFRYQTIQQHIQQHN